MMSLSVVQNNVTLTITWLFLRIFGHKSKGAKNEFFKSTHENSQENTYFNTCISLLFPLSLYLFILLKKMLRFLFTTLFPIIKKCKKKIWHNQPQNNEIIVCITWLFF